MMMEPTSRREMSSVRRQLFPRSGNRRRRLFVRREACMILVAAILFVYQYSGMPVDQYAVDSPRDVFREAATGQERLIQMLQEAGIHNMTAADVKSLPTWKDIEDLYGSSPVIKGLEHCHEFRKRVPSSQRFIGIAGNFNSGTTAFGISLADNCRFPDHAQNISNDVVQDVNGMLNQVPWAKHKPAYNRNEHTIEDRIVKDHVLPVVLVRDPYRWMASMCVQGYGVQWSHTDKHCPNLVPNDHDVKRFKNLRNKTSVPIHMRGDVKFPSLVHHWNDWYGSYWNADFPRLMIRFEDTLYHGKEVMEQVCQCGGGVMKPKFQYHTGEAKWNHGHKQNNFLSAMIKYGSSKDRYRNMTLEDKQFARDNLNAELMTAFRYTY